MTNLISLHQSILPIKYIPKLNPFTRRYWRCAKCFKRFYVFIILATSLFIRWHVIRSFIVKNLQTRFSQVFGYHHYITLNFSPSLALLTIGSLSLSISLLSSSLSRSWLKGKSLKNVRSMCHVQFSINQINIPRNKNNSIVKLLQATDQ